ncbi:hypothetical protein OA92_21255 [Marinomonas sp. SBI22]|uniref:hypothetical protein n=1 Tax=unclassified Marinomonas TaxID=196814 RepID=UPI0007AF6153|nr:MULTISPECIES: hypothetical protein [unclassified Marinomonas]KZM39125.1 hypothetical protein OA92_21255 [Marinomonas sp. SBI22]KZM39909.1 hypothetical protein OA91_21110 [Marinomonas sp. SBI8L]
MYNTLITTEYNLPDDVDLNLSEYGFIKAMSLQQSLTLEEKLQDAQVQALNEVERKAHLAIESITEEKNAIIAALAQQIESINDTQQDALRKVEQACHSILAEVFSRFHANLSSMEKLHFSVSELVKSHQHKDDVCLVVRHLKDWQQSHLTLPEGWQVKEDPTLEVDCLLAMNNGEVVCDFDTVFLNITQAISAIEY